MYTGLTAKLTAAVMNGATEGTSQDVAYISNWSIEETRDILEVTELGKSTKAKKATLYSWTASADGSVDFATAGSHSALRDAMVAGKEVKVKFYLEMATKEKVGTYLEGKALIEKMSVDISAEDKGNISISLSGIDALEIKTEAMLTA